MLDHLTAPLAAGAVDNEVAIDSAAQAVVARTTRFPLLLAAPAAPLEAERLRLKATLAAGPGPPTVVDLEWAPYTEAGAFLPVWSPDFDPAVPQTVAFTFALELRRRPSGSSETQVAPGQVASQLDLRLIEGITGQTLYLLGAEKQRLRRTARELSATCRLAAARDDAADRLGAELGVPRFADRLKYDGGAIVSETAREPDADYRRRLALYRGTFLRSRNRLLELLNGPGGQGDPNAGPIGQLASSIPAGRRPNYQRRFELVDRNNDFAVAIHIMAAGDPALRANFFDFIRAVHLILPLTSDSSIHAKRFLPKSRKDREDALRKTLRKLFDFTSLEPGKSPGLAPMLAYALVRAARCIEALGGPSPWQVFRTQRNDRGSRYELGLGADLKRLTAAQLDSLKTAHDALRNQNPPFSQFTDPDPADPKVKEEVRGLLSGMTAQPASADPDGRWLLEPCGLRTVHRVPRPGAAPFDLTYMSHFPTFGMTVAEVPPGTGEIGVGGISALITLPGAGFADVLLAYERDTGAFQLWDITDPVPLTPGPRSTGRGTTWSAFAVGDFSAKRANVLMYDASKGEARFFGVEGAAVVNPLGPAVTGLRKTWSHVAAYQWDGTSHVLFYDRGKGEAEIHETDGSGALALLATHNEWRTTWTHIVELRTPAGFSELFLYDATSGDAEILTPDGAGGLTLRKRVGGLDAGWSHVVPGWFGGDPHGQGVLFYNQATGRTERYDYEGTRLQADELPPNCDLESALYSPAEISGVFTYSRRSGRAELWVPTGEGNLMRAGVATGLPKSVTQTMEARYHAPGDRGSNVVLAAGLAAADAAWTASGGAAWTVLSNTAATTAWNQAATHAQNDRVLQVFRAAGLPALTDPQPLVQRLKAMRPELLDTVQLDAAQSQAIVTGTGNVTVANAAQGLVSIMSILKTERLTSVLPLVTTADEVLLVVSVSPLPVAGINLAEQISASFRWYAIPLQGPEPEVRAVGARTEVAPAGDSLFALVALGYARRGLTDPYEFRVELPPGALLTLEQYEFLMNLLDHAYPAGVRANTWPIRQFHVDLKGDGKVSALDPTISRTYRAFRRPRHRGESSVTLEET